MVTVADIEELFDLTRPIEIITYYGARVGFECRACRRVPPSRRRLSVQSWQKPVGPPPAGGKEDPCSPCSCSSWLCR